MKKHYKGLICLALCIVIVLGFVFTSFFKYNGNWYFKYDETIMFKKAEDYDSSVLLKCANVKWVCFAFDGEVDCKDLDKVKSLQEIIFTYKTTYSDLSFISKLPNLRKFWGQIKSDKDLDYFKNCSIYGNYI